MSKLALVTGASSGIGRAFAQRLAADGYDLVVTGRRRDRLEELAATLTSVTVEPMTADLSTDEGVDAIAALCATQPLAMLVNNAGVAHYCRSQICPLIRRASWCTSRSPPRSCWPVPRCRG